MSAARRKAAPTKRQEAEQEPALRKTELIGLTDDGRMVLWDTGMVRPVSKFEMHGKWIESDHYVIQWRGHAITVHCSSCIDGRISVLFMCGTGSGIYLPRDEVEEMLLGKVIHDPEVQAKISAALKELGDSIARSSDTPDRQRGHI